jgi:hypothetical protein
MIFIFIICQITKFYPFQNEFLKHPFIVSFILNYVFVNFTFFSFFLKKEKFQFQIKRKFQFHNTINAGKCSLESVHCI